MLDIIPAQTKKISCSRYKVVLTKMSEIFIILLLTKLFLHIYLVKLTYHVEKAKKIWYQLDRILGQEGAWALGRQVISTSPSSKQFYCLGWIYGW